MSYNTISIPDYMLADGSSMSKHTEAIECFRDQQFSQYLQQLLLDYVAKVTAKAPLYA
jgi:hypothetical protein